jgi:hypothetical protein
MNTEINTILKDIAVQTIKIMLFKVPVFSNCIEGIFIVPLYYTTSLFYTCLFTSLKPALHGLENQISFINIDNESLKISCDWCSICNGVVETAKINIVNYLIASKKNNLTKNSNDLIKKIDFKKLKLVDSYFRFVLSGRKIITTDRQIVNWCLSTFNQTSPELLLFASLYLNLEMLELRWCPFKRAKDFYYRNSDPRYLPLDDQVIYAVGKILAQHETITCNNCPKIINKYYTPQNFTLKKSTLKNKSIFDDLLKYMLMELNTTII